MVPPKSESDGIERLSFLPQPQLEMPFTHNPGIKNLYGTGHKNRLRIALAKRGKGIDLIYDIRGDVP
jgi:hypothetical protein